MSGPGRAAALLALAGILAACGGSSSAGQLVASPSPSVAPSVVYAAIGASETVGVGATNPRTEAWPTVFAASALPKNAVYRNYGISGETVGGALTEEVPKALRARPTLVTVWLNVNYLNSGVKTADYQSQLQQLVRAMRQGGRARVLVANTPWLDKLPLYVLCRNGTAAFQCPPAVRTLQPSAINAAVDAYNLAIAAVVRQEGAELVDLHAQGEVSAEHPGYVSGDGFHPSTAGHAAVAEAFLTQYQQGLGATPLP
jgi:acyl-CoA thioesterase-1